MQVIVDGLLTTYEDSGEGKVLVLLHGWGDQAAGLRGVQKALSKRYRVIIPDLPGFGATQSPPIVWGLTEYATFTCHFIEKLRLGKVYAYIGHSNGGAIMIRGLGKHILEADRMVLMASAGIRGEYKGRKRFIRYIVKAGKALTMPLPKRARKAIQKKVYHTIGSDMLVAEHLQETFKRVVTDDVRSDAERVTIPALLIYGENDDATPVRYGELFHEVIAGSTLEILPGAGHFVHVDRLRAVVQSMEGFLQ